LTIAPRCPSASGSLRDMMVAAWRVMSKVPMRLISTTLRNAARSWAEPARRRARSCAAPSRCPAGVDAGTQRRDVAGGLDGAGDLVGVGHVDPCEDALDLLGQRLAHLGVDVCDDDDRPTRGQGTGDCGTDAARAAR
jgi:hypothetical protein